MIGNQLQFQRKLKSACQEGILAVAMLVKMTSKSLRSKNCTEGSRALISSLDSYVKEAYRNHY